MAFTSACAVGSLVAVTEFAPSPTILPSRTITAANGPPLPAATFSVASAMARRKNSGLGLPGTFLVLHSAREMQRQIQYGTSSYRFLRTAERAIAYSVSLTPQPHRHPQSRRSRRK